MQSFISRKSRPTPSAHPSSGTGGQVRLEGTHHDFAVDTGPEEPQLIELEAPEAPHLAAQVGSNPSYGLGAGAPNPSYGTPTPISQSQSPFNASEASESSIPRFNFNFLKSIRGAKPKPARDPSTQRTPHTHTPSRHNFNFILNTFRAGSTPNSAPSLTSTNTSISNSNAARSSRNQNTVHTARNVGPARASRNSNAVRNSPNISENGARPRPRRKRNCNCNILPSGPHRKHTLMSGLLVFFAFVEGVISTWLSDRYSRNKNYPSISVRDCTRFLAFASWWTVLFSFLFGALFWNNSDTVLTSVGAHGIFLIITWIFWSAGAGAITSYLRGGNNCSTINFTLPYCNQLNALEGFAWAVWVLISVALIFVVIRGFSAARRAPRFHGQLVVP